MNPWRLDTNRTTLVDHNWRFKLQCRRLLVHERAVASIVRNSTMKLRYETIAQQPVVQQAHCNVQTNTREATHQIQRVSHTTRVLAVRYARQAIWERIFGHRRPSAQRTRIKSRDTVSPNLNSFNSVRTNECCTPAGQGNWIHD
jgi:hypothetical protein